MPFKRPPELDVPLTAQQQQLVTENHNLIYGFLHKHRLDERDWYDDMAIALCLAARNYDPSRSTFATCAYIYFQGALKRRRVRECRAAKAISIQPFSVVVHNRDGTRYEIDGDIGEEDSGLERVEQEALVQQLLARVKPKTRRVYELYRRGMTQQQIGRALKVSHQSIAKHLSMLKQAAREMMEEKGGK